MEGKKKKEIKKKIGISRETKSQSDIGHMMAMSMDNIKGSRSPGHAQTPGRHYPDTQTVIRGAGTAGLGWLTRIVVTT